MCEKKLERGDQKKEIEITIETEVERRKWRKTRKSSGPESTKRVIKEKVRTECQMLTRKVWEWDV